MRDPEPLRQASPPMRKRLARVLRQHLGLKEALTERVDVVDRLMTRVAAWLKRDDLPLDARQDAEDISNERNAGPGL